MHKYLIIAGYILGTAALSPASAQSSETSENRIVPPPVAVAPSPTVQTALAPVDPARLAIAREVIELGLPSDQREAYFVDVTDKMMVQMRQAMAGNLPSDDPQLTKILDDWLDKWTADCKVVLKEHVPDIMEGWAQGYAAMFSVSELNDLRTFMSTPTGHKFFIRSSEIMSEPHFAAANQAYMRDIYGRLPGAKAGLMKEIAAYVNGKSKKAK